MEIVERIERIFQDALSIELPSETTDIVAAGLLDSLALVTLLFELEEQFGVTIPLEDLDIESLRSVQLIAALIGSLLTESGSLGAVDGGVRP